MALENNFGKEKVLKASFLFWNNTIKFLKNKRLQKIFLLIGKFFERKYGN